MQNLEIQNSIVEKHQFLFGDYHLVVKAPGRVNIIGEHTDYNQGLTLPFAIDQSVYFCIQKNDSDLINIHAHNYNESVTLHFDDLAMISTGWQRYFSNVIFLLRDELSGGLNITFGGDLPIGCGISSSSAIATGFIFALNSLFELNYEKNKVISIASQAENGIGLEGGKMDQTIILMGKSGMAILMDFLKNDTTYIDLKMGSHQFYLIESGQKHNLVETAYNTRRQACTTGLSKVKKTFSEVQSFRDLSIDVLENSDLTDEEYRLLLHQIEENNRVLQACEAINDQDFEKLGRLISQSHISLSRNYSVSTPEIDQLVNLCMTEEQVLGARIMGGGFGGSIILLADGKITELTANRIIQKYQNDCKLIAKMHRVSPCNGIEILAPKFSN